MALTIKLSLHVQRKTEHKWDQGREQKTLNGRIKKKGYRKCKLKIQATNLSLFLLLCAGLQGRELEVLGQQT
jgi:hypothetical protein